MAIDRAAREHEEKAPEQAAAPVPQIPPGMSNAALARAATTGAALPSNAHAALRALGPQAAAVRLHTGAAADAKLAARPGALAATEGTDIFVGRSAPALDSPGGELLLAHEAAHVRQQTTAGPAVSRETAEVEADQAAVAASVGAPLPAFSPASGTMYFEARWHQASLTGAMRGLGFTDAEQQAAYFGNWCRDLSQALVPIATGTIGAPATFQVVNLLAMHKFGHGVTPAQLGTYDPRQHIDNPAGQTDRDVLPSGVTIDGYGSEGHAAGPQDAGALSPERIRESYAVSAAGVPAYMEDSRRLAEEEALAAIEAGRTPEGMMHVGAFSHIVEDLFAHSNWIEIAVGRVVSEHPDLIPAGETRDEVQERLNEGRPPIENYAADVAAAGHAARPILSTGTYSGGSTGNDTLISVKAELMNILRDREPFKEDGGGGEMYDFAIEVLRNAEASAEEGSLGDIFTAVVEHAVSNLGGMALGAADELADDLRSAGGDGFWGRVAEGAADLIDEGADVVAGAASDAWRSTLRDAIRDGANGLGGAISFAEMAVYLKGEANSIADAWKDLKDAVRGLPDAIKELILPALVAAEREFKQRVRQLLNAAYGRAVELFIDTLEGIHPAADAAETNVGVKEEHLRERLDELKGEMQEALIEVGGDEGARVAAQLDGMSHEELGAFAMSDAFQQILAGLVADVSARARLQSAASSMSDTAHTVNQLGNIPKWAKAGASHSQIAKDHDDGAFFGVAFTCAQVADTMLMSALQAAWMDRGDIGPGAGMEENYGTESTGNEAEDARRRRFRETRDAGDYVREHGVGENMDIGPRLVSLADGLEAVIDNEPLVGPALRGLVWVLRHSDDVHEVEEELRATRARWEEEARSGRFDDAVMESVDRAVGAVARVVGAHGTDEHGDEHDFDSHHPAAHDGHAHGGRNETAYASQLETLQAHRGRNAIAADDSVGADRATPASEQIVEQIRLIFNHPYENNWWYETVHSWCADHPGALERSVHDRNAGVMHSHSH